MTSDDQQFLDLLASIPQDMAHYGSRVADYIERHANSIASDLRDAIDQSTWIPNALRPLRPSSSGSGSTLFARPPPAPQGLYERTADFLSRNRTAIAIVVAFAGTTVYLVHRRRKAHIRKRRVKRFPNGAKREIVVLACSSFHDALTRSLALDLERRGYVVYVTVSSADEDALVQQETKADIRPLWIDLTSTVPNPAVDIHPNLEPIRELLKKSSPPSQFGRSTQGAPVENMNMTLAGVVVFPGCSGYAEGPLAILQPSDVVDTINTRLVSPLLTIQQLLPLLANHSLDPKCPSSIVIAYPSIPRSLSPPRQIPECLVASSLSAVASSLRREVTAAQANVTVSELKLGNFDMGSVSSRTPAAASHHPPATTTSALTTTTHWHSSQRAALQRMTLGQRSLIRGSSAREFHNAVFDALAPPQTFKAFGRLEWTTSSRADVMFVGNGAWLYHVVGQVAPSGLVAWMMGFRKRTTQDEEARWKSPSSQGYQSVYRNGGDNSTDTRPSASAAAAAAAAHWGSNSAGSESGIWEKV